MVGLKEYGLFKTPLQDAAPKEKEYPFEVFADFPESWKVVDPDLVKEGHLRLLSETDKFRHFEFELKYRKRRALIAEEATTESGKFSIWQHKGGFAMAVNSSKEISEVAGAFLSVILYGDLHSIKLHRINRPEFLVVAKHAKSLEGEISLLHLTKIRTKAGNLSVFHVTGENPVTVCEHLGLDVNKLINSSENIRRMGFRIPRLGDSAFNFWIGHWGGGTLYSPDEFLPHQVQSLLKFFEDALLLGRQKNEI